MIRVFLVDDHTLVRKAVRGMLETATEISVVGEASTGEEAINLIASCQPDVILLDVKMPGMGGIEATKRLQRVAKNAKILVLTAYAEEPFPTHLLQAGASGFITKECTLEELLQAIHKVNMGGRYIHPDVATQMALKNLGTESQQEVSPIEKLSQRELQVMLMITSGYKVAEIATKLCLSKKTVNTYRYRLFRKFNINSDVELTHLALRYHLLDKNIDMLEPEA